MGQMGKRFLVELILLLAILGFVGQAQAATRTWTGTTNANWSVGTNWGGTAPVAGDALVFPTGTSNQTTNNDITAGTSFASITVSGTGYTLAGYDIVLAGGITDSAGSTISLNIALTNTSHGTSVSSGKTLNLNGVISGLGSITNSGAGIIYLNGANTYSGGTTVDAGTINIGNATALGTGGLTMPLGSSGTLNGGSTSFTIVGDIAFIEGTFNLSTATTTFSGSFNCASLSSCFTHNNGIVELNGSGTQNWASEDSSVLAIFSFHHLTHSGSGTFIFGLNVDSVNVGGNLLNSNGIFDFDAISPTVVGNFTNNATLRLQGPESLPATLISGSSSLVQYYGISVASEDPPFDLVPIVLKNWNYVDLQLSASSASTYALPGNLTLTGNLTIDADNTLDTTASNYNLNVAGDWTNNGAFTANSGTVTLDGTNQTLSGATTFHNLTKTDPTNNSTDLTLTFPALATTTVSGLLTFTGLDSNDRVNLVSSTPGTYWGLTANGTFAIDYVDVTDSDASLGSRIMTTNTISGGHNLNWETTPTVSSLGPTSLIDGSWTTDNTPTFTFTTADADGDTVAYELTLDNDSDFSSPAYQATSTYIAPGAGSLGYETNYFGKLTQQALGLFQLKNNLITSPNDIAFGYLGPKTRALINGLK